MVSEIIYNRKFQLFFIGALCLATILVPTILHAETFVSLSNPGDLPGLESTDAPEESLTNLLNWLFIIALGAGALLAVIMIAIAGIKYMGTDSYSSKESAKESIRNAVIGLVILLGSWLFLYTINPELVQLNAFQRAQGTALGDAPATAPAADTAIIVTTSQECVGENCCAGFGDSWIQTDTRVEGEDVIRTCRPTVDVSGI